MYAVRLDTSPADGSSTKVVIMNLFSGNSEIGPRLILWNFEPSSADATSRPTGGTVTTPPITAPRPRVAPSRNRLRGKRSPEAGTGAAGATGFAAAAAEAGAGGGGGVAA